MCTMSMKIVILPRDMGSRAAEQHHGRPVGSGVIWPSAKTVYALRACAELATAYPQRHLLKTAEIAGVSGTPIRFLSKILSELRAAGIVTGKRGYNGGYILARDPNEIRLTELMRAVGSHDLLVPLPPRLEQPR